MARQLEKERSKWEKTEGDYFQTRGGSNIEGVGKEPNMDSDDVWSTSLKSAEQGKGRKEGWVVESGKETGGCNGPIEYGPWPNMEGSKESEGKEIEGLGRKD